MSRFKDFDEAVASLDPIRFKVAGREYALTEEPPASTILGLLREDLEENPAGALEILEELIGKQHLDQMLTDGASLTQVGMLAKWIAEQCGIGEVETSAEPGGNGSAPKSQSKTSSKSGR